MKTTKIYLDIETIPSEVKPSLDEVKAPANYKDEEKILAYKKDNQLDAWKKQALDSIDGRILCIGVAVNDEEPIIFSGHEKDIMVNFESWIFKQNNIVRIIGHNIKGFDALFIFHKAIKYKLPYLISLFNGARRDEIDDTMIMLDGTAWKTMISLDRACKLIGIDGKGDISGKDVFDYWQTGREQEIYDYCKSDVIKVREVYLAIKQEFE